MHSAENLAEVEGNTGRHDVAGMDDGLYGEWRLNNMYRQGRRQSAPLGKVSGMCLARNGPLAWLKTAR